jgi:transcription antitermination factor NusA-like protein
MKGSRIHGIVRELRNENIDIINYTTNIHLFMQRSLTPAKITTIDIDHEAQTRFRLPRSRSGEPGYRKKRLQHQTSH